MSGNDRTITLRRWPLSDVTERIRSHALSNDSVSMYHDTSPPLIVHSSMVPSLTRYSRAADNRSGRASDRRFARRPTVWGLSLSFGRILRARAFVSAALGVRPV